MMFRSFIYDSLFGRLTTAWYQTVLARTANNSRVLDVGIGTGGALVRSAALVRAKNLRITGIDIDADYIEVASRRIEAAGLGERVKLRLESVYDHQESAYDVVYFSASFMLLPEPERALQHVTRLLNPGGRVFFTQTFNERRSYLLERMKPLLGKFTTVDFGRVTYEDEFLATLRAAGLSLEEFVVMNDTSFYSYRLAIAAPHGQPRGSHPAFPTAF